MSAIPVIAIFDIGKTNKKLFLFDGDYKIVFEKSAYLPEIADEDGYPCENLESLKQFIFGSLSEVMALPELQVKAVNVSAYGASLVYLGDDGKPVAPLYNYLKPYPGSLSKQFYETYGSEEQFSITTASPVLGSLNSGLQIYRLKQEKPKIFKQIKCALHLPEYISYLLTGKFCSQLTSIGCHTAMWDFEKNRYHDWIRQKKIENKLAPIVPANKTSTVVLQERPCKVGVGLHDSSAALIPYLLRVNEPFVLISTGTWCISLNPFNHLPLTAAQLKRDCLCYLDYRGKPVKASRLFSGFEYEQQVKRIAAYFNQDTKKYGDVTFDPEIISRLIKDQQKTPGTDTFNKESAFAAKDLPGFKNDIEAYHQLILDLVNLQVASTQLVLKGTSVKRIFVDGGFSKNSVFMYLLASALPDMEVFAATMAQASALGAALAIHKDWNDKAIPKEIIRLKHYSVY